MLRTSLTAFYTRLSWPILLPTAWTWLLRRLSFALLSLVPTASNQAAGCLNLVSQSHPHQMHDRSIAPPLRLWLPTHLLCRRCQYLHASNHRNSAWQHPWATCGHPRKAVIRKRRGSLRSRCPALAYLQVEEAAAMTAHTVGRTVLDTVRTTAGQSPQRRRTRR